jgi:hypothetical protein
MILWNFVNVILRSRVSAVVNVRPTPARLVEEEDFEDDEEEFED